MTPRYLCCVAAELVDAADREGRVPTSAEVARTERLLDAAVAARMAEMWDEDFLELRSA